MVHFKGEGWPSLFNYMCGRYDFDWCPPPLSEAFKSQGVFIGKSIGREQKGILGKLEKCKIVNEHLELTHFRALRIDPPSPCRCLGRGIGGAGGKGEGTFMKTWLKGHAGFCRA